MSLGTLCSAYIAMFISKNYIFDPWGLLGGTLWSIGNFCVIPIVKTIGLGLGLLLWSCTSIITGFFTGKFGLFGLVKQQVAHPALNWAGFACIVGAIVFFFFIKPTLDDEKEDKQHKYSSIVEDYHPILNARGVNSEYDLNGAMAADNDKMFFEKFPAPLKTLTGIVLAVFSGILYGINMVPMQLWKQDNPTDSPLSFIFCHFSGIFLFNTIVFIVYAIIKRPPQFYPQTILPSFISGFMWGIANCGLMVATQILGYTVGFPIGSSGPMVISSLWSVLFFKEIQGVKNLLILLVSFMFLGTGIALLALSS